jgi:hypothetical protein
MKWPWPTIRYYFDIYLEGMRSTMKTLSEEIDVPDEILTGR